MKTRITFMLAGLTMLAFTVTRAFAVEGGLSRPISGMQIAPFAGVISPEPGRAVATGELCVIRKFPALPGLRPRPTFPLAHPRLRCQQMRRRRRIQLQRKLEILIASNQTQMVRSMPPIQTG